MKLSGYLRANKPHRGLFSRHYYTILSSRFATGKAICQKKRCGKNLCMGPRRKIPVILKKALAATEMDYEALKDVRVSSPGRIWLLFEYRNALIESRVYLSAMIDYALRKGGSRGSAIYSDEKGSVQPEALDERFRFSLENEDSPDIQEIKLDGNSVSITYRQPRPIPQDDGFFENVWARYRKDGCVY